MRAKLFGSVVLVAANGDPSSAALPWPSFNNDGQVLSLLQPQAEVDSDNAARHHCAFWSAG
jgi:para-nitrobenzyl esterase